MQILCCSHLYNAELARSAWLTDNIIIYMLLCIKAVLTTTALSSATAISNSQFYQIHSIYFILHKFIINMENIDIIIS